MVKDDQIILADCILSNLKELEIIDNTAVELDEEKETVEEKDFKNGKYVIVAGCFQSYQNATNFVQELATLGYPAAPFANTYQLTRLCLLLRANDDGSLGGAFGCNGHGYLS